MPWLFFFLSTFSPVYIFYWLSLARNFGWRRKQTPHERCESQLAMGSQHNSRAYLNQDVRLTKIS